jgi:hypothetical protein
MKAIQYILAAIFCAAFGIANAAGMVKTYTVEPAFAADDVIEWSVAGAADAPQTLSGAGGAVAAAAVQSGNLERVPTVSRLAGDRSASATLLGPAGILGPVTVTFGSGPVMGVGVHFEGGAGRITAKAANGNILATAVSGADGFAGIRSSLKEIAGVVIESPTARYSVSVALTPLTANNVFFVNQLFQDLFGRMPSARELEDTVDAIRTSTMTRAEIAAGMLTSGEFHDRASYLAKCFIALMRRDADFPRWSLINSLMRQGASRDEALAAFLATPEFTAVYPASLGDAAFVTKIHQDILGRRPENSELETWTTQIARGCTRAEIVDTLLQSPQLEARLAGRINISLSYLTFLNREAGAETLDRWAAALDGGAPLTDVINSVLSSSEYASRF